MGGRGAGGRGGEVQEGLGLRLPGRWDWEGPSSRGDTGMQGVS